MEFPPWFQKAIQLRLDDVSAQIEHDCILKQIREETDEAFEALFADKDVVPKPEYAEWENLHIISMGIQNELLYRQGLRDGIQLIVSILGQSMGVDGVSESSNTHKAQ